VAGRGGAPTLHADARQRRRPADGRPDHEAWLDDNICLDLGLYLLESDEAATSKMEAVPNRRGVVFTVVAQLRRTFAARFLMAAGQHLSRAGVDFIDL